MYTLVISVLYFSIGLVKSLDNINDPDDGYGRSYPNQLLNGFFPVWVIILLCLAGAFLLISLISFILYIFGCRPQTSEFKKLPGPK